MSAKVRTKYVTLDGCGSARLASSSVTDAIQKLAEDMSPTVCQELVGCASGCMEKVKGKNLSSKDCKDFDSCLAGCRDKAGKEPIQFKAARKAPVKAKVAVKPARMVSKDTAKEECCYAKLRRQYNRLLGVHERPPVRSPEKPTEQLKEGSPEYFIAQHRRALGRPRGSCY